MTAVPFLDLRRLHESIRPDLDAAFSQVLDTNAFVGAAACLDFETAFAAAHARRFAVGCNSGTDALALALRAAGIGRDDEVVVPSMTFFATAEAVFHAGARPVLADVDPVTLLLTPAQVDVVRTRRTRAVVPVHLYGHVVPFAHLRAWQDEGLIVIEDAAQAHLATDGLEPVGTAGQAACFSFFPGKNLGALGDAGAVLTDDDALAAFVRRQRDHGRSSKYLHNEIGMSSRLDGLQAAFLLAKLQHLPDWTEKRRRLADHYARLLAGVTNIRLVPWRPGDVHHLVVVLVADGRREDVQQRLAGAGIGSGVHYPVPLSGQPALAAYTRPTPVAERAASEVLSLPIDPLMTFDDVERVVDALAG